MIDYLTVNEVSERLSMHRKTIEAKIKSGEIFSVNLFGSSRLIRVPETEVRRILKEAEKGVKNA